MYEEACWWPMPGWCTSCTPSLSVNRSESRTRSTALRGGERFGRDEGVSREGFGLAGNGVGRDDDDGRRRRRGEGDAPRGEGAQKRVLDLDAERELLRGRLVEPARRRTGGAVPRDAPPHEARAGGAPRPQRDARGRRDGSEHDLPFSRRVGRPRSLARECVINRAEGRRAVARPRPEPGHTQRLRRPPRHASRSGWHRAANGEESAGENPTRRLSSSKNKYLRGIRFSRMSD